MEVNVNKIKFEIWERCLRDANIICSSSKDIIVVRFMSHEKIRLKSCLNQR